MTINETEKIKIFCCCAPVDSIYYIHLEKHFSSIKQTYHLEMRSNLDIKAGEKWQKAIDDSLSSAHLIFLLFSVDFINSDYYNEIMHSTLEQPSKQKAKVIPILLRPCDWEETPIRYLWVLPRDKKPVIDRGRNIDQAFTDIVQEIKLIIKQINEEIINEKINKIKSRPKEGWLKETSELYEKAVEAAKNAIYLDDNYVDAYIWKAEALRALGRKKEALATYYKVFCLDPENDNAHIEIPRLLLELNSEIVKAHGLNPKNPDILRDAQKINPPSQQGKFPLARGRYRRDTLSQNRLTRTPSWPFWLSWVGKRSCARTPSWPLLRC